MISVIFMHVVKHVPTLSPHLHIKHTTTHHLQHTDPPTNSPYLTHPPHLIPPTLSHPPHPTSPHHSHLITATSSHPPHQTHLITPTSSHPPYLTHLISPTSPYAHLRKHSSVSSSCAGQRRYEYPPAWLACNAQETSTTDPAAHVTLYGERGRREPTSPVFAWGVSTYAAPKLP
jgi:hypothetical protein